MPKYLDIKVFLTNRDGNVNDIVHKLHTLPRQFYRYLDIAYMNPENASQILDSTIKLHI